MTGVLEDLFPTARTQPATSLMWLAALRAAMDRKLKFHKTVIAQLRCWTRESPQAGGSAGRMLTVP